MYQPLERGELRSKGRRKTTIHSNEVRQILSCASRWSLRQSAESLRSSRGYDCRTASWLESSGKPVASCQLDKQEIITQPPLAELQANEEQQGNLLQEYVERFEKLSEDQKLSRLCSEAGLRLVEIGLFLYALPSPRGEGNQCLCRVCALPRDQKGTKIKGWIQRNVRFGPASDIEVCNKYGRNSIEVPVQSLFKDQTESWTRIVNGIDKFVSEAMPIQEEETALVKPAAEAKPILKPSSRSGWDSFGTKTVD